MVCIQNYTPTVPYKMTALKFMTQDTLAVVLDDCSVQIYDIPSNAMIHNIRLIHPISSVDAWNGRLLIGSSLVHVVDTRQSGQWHRTVVVDLKEQDSIKSPSQHLAVFSSVTGEFVTASAARNRITF